MSVHFLNLIYLNQTTTAITFPTVEYKYFNYATIPKGLLFYNFLICNKGNLNSGCTAPSVQA
jgi:hypothetical protein